jgi:nucleoside-diphosphate-sugar epimerase
MIFFITGGSGFLGINMIRHLLKKGHNIVSYDLLPFDYPEKDKIKWIVGDIRNFDFLNKSMQGSDVVVHMAAALPLYSAEDIRTTDIDGTGNVCEASLQNGVKKMVHISSTAVYGIPDHHPLFETDCCRRDL